jgi:beta-1,4-mannosyl-glycoprotein beta-1,4-N-acetylglucosaminyltransferase
MKIYDCFTYYNESNLIKIRIEELKDVVDYFVIIEANQTFTGLTKPFYFDELEESLKEYSHKILRFKINFPDKDMSAWDREFFQRNSITQCLEEILADDEDIILISDADEIARGSIIKRINKYKLPTRLDVSQYFWTFNWKAPDHCNQGARPIACRFKHLKEKGAQNLRAETKPMIDNAGWHFSFFADLDKIKKKIESFAHTEYDSIEYKDSSKVLYRIQNGIDPFDRFPLKYYEIDESYPVYLKNKS